MASPFKVLELNYQIMIWLRMYEHHCPFTNVTNNFSLSMYCISLNLFAFIVASAMFVYQNTANIMGALRSGMITLGTSQALGMFLSVGSNIDKVKLLHQKLQAIVDQSAKDGLIHITEMYWATEQKCYKFTRLMVYYTFCNSSSLVIALNYAIYCICTGNLDTSAWNLPFNLVMPFNTEPMWGWFLHWLVQFSANITYTLCMIIPTCYFTSFCRYIVAICNHFELLVDAIQWDVERIQSDTEDCRQKYRDKWHHVREKLFQLIDHHVNALDIFTLMANINSGAIFSLLPVNAVVLGLSMYTMENSKFDLVVFMIDMLCVVCAMMWCSLFCYFANTASDRLSSIGNIAFNTNWYYYPVEWQKFIFLIAIRSRKPVYFKGLNVISCTLEVFGNIFKSACSYYVIFRSFSQI